MLTPEPRQPLFEEVQVSKSVEYGLSEDQIANTVDRDDLTVEVIFFGKGDKTGDVTMNHEASNPGLGAKPKL